ncbi:MAG TPA: hypothetical protein VFV57_02440 [Limnobacter sp.]|nr:hypothetical protein [Limnobacter sp.]
MFDLGAFFRRNQRLLWLVIAAFMVFFVSVQLSKSFASLDTNYGEISECNYTHQPSGLQNPVRSSAPQSNFCTGKS